MPTHRTEPPSGGFLSRALDEFARADRGRQLLDEARALAEAKRYEAAYGLLRAGLMRLGRWREDATAALVEFALAAGVRPLPRLSDEFAELVRVSRGGGPFLLPVLEIFERAGHEERKELLFDHLVTSGAPGGGGAPPGSPASAGRDPALVDVLPIERLHSLGERGLWATGGPAITSLAGRARQKCLALWEVCRLLIFPEREPWSTRQLEGKLPLPDWLTALLRPLLEIKLLRTLAGRAGAALRLPRPVTVGPHESAAAGPTIGSASSPAPAEAALGDWLMAGSAAFRAATDGWCRPNCPLLEAVRLWVDAGLLLGGRRAALPQAELASRLVVLRDAASPASACRAVREGFLRSRIDQRLQQFAEALAAELGRPRASKPIGRPGMLTVPAGLIRGRSLGVPSFQIGIAPVTRAEYAEFDPGIERRAGDEAAPMTGVSWFAARAYVRWRGGDLPTNSQWTLALKTGQLEFPPTSESQPLAAEWGSDWTLTGAEKVQLTAATAPTPSPSGSALPAPAETGLPPSERAGQVGFRLVL